MDKQIIISIGREFGSGGHQIATDISKHFNLPLYDKSILENIAKEKGVDVNELCKFDEIPKNRLFFIFFQGHSSSPEEAIANMQFDFLREKASSGESFVVVGRCANSILKEYDGLISVFVTADMEKKIDRVAEYFDIDREQAHDIIVKNNKKRKLYHNFYCKEKWGDSRHYELIINTSRIGIPQAKEIVQAYVEKYIESNK